MAIYYFKTGTGEPFTDKTDAGDDAVAKGHAIKVDDAPEGVLSLGECLTILVLLQLM